jgi:uncharacterized protein with WD repeat
MEQKTCNACGRSFTPRPQTPHQTYCTHPECQRERRRRWQQQKRQGDSDYRDNDIRNSRTWGSENPQYWKQYRDENPDYVGRNRNLQHQRNQKQRSALIANEDVSNPFPVFCRAATAWRESLPMGRLRPDMDRRNQPVDGANGR